MTSKKNRQTVTSEESALFAQGFSQYRAGRLTEAADICNKILQGDGRHAGALLLSALIGAGRTAQSANWGEAAQRYNAILALLLNDAAACLKAAAQIPLASLQEALAKTPPAPIDTGALNNFAAAKPIGAALGGQPGHLPSAVDALFIQAVKLHQVGQLAEAAMVYRQILQSDPDNLATLNNLGLISPPALAAPLLRRAVALRPDYVDATMNLGNILETEGRLDKAATLFNRAIIIMPGNADACFKLGSLFGAAGLSNVAAEWFKQVLVRDPNNETANWNLVCTLVSESRLAEAEFYRSRIVCPKPYTIDEASDRRRTVLLLQGVNGMVPYQTLVPQQSNTRINWHVVYGTDEQEAQLPAHDIVFNVVGNAEMSEIVHPRMIRFVNKSPRRVLNRPEKILMTRRDRMPRLLGDIPNVVIPPVMRLARQDAASHLVAKLAAGGVTCPLIVRPVSGQGGKGVILVETAAQLAALPLTDADAYYFIAYHDYRSADGFFRKYRTIFVDRRPYHYHLAISPQWLVHYFSAEMLAEPWKRDEEQQFLDHPTEALGAPAAAAVEAIGRRMDLDYGGIDYTILADGRVLVFEANATMSVYIPDANDFPYKQHHVKAVFAAFEEMLTRYAAA